MERLTGLYEVLDSAQERISTGESALGHVWATGFTPLDALLTGGLRAGELVLIGGPQGLGKSMFVLQLLRHVVVGGGAGACFSYELDEGHLLERILVQEAYVTGEAGAPTLQQLRRQLAQEDGEPEAPTLADRLAPLPGMPAAQAAVRGYADRLAIHVSSSRTTTTAVIRDLVLEAVATGKRPVVVVDYLQKVHVETALGEDERVTTVVEALKDLAVEAQVPVVAVTAATQAGIAPGHRLRVHELRGSSALAYEADVILLFNEKHDVVAKHHLAYDPRSAERFKQVVIVSVEKNRSGPSDVHLELRKDFEHCRFDPVGNLVREQLSDARLSVE